jgi:hypothetical protein
MSPQNEYLEGLIFAGVPVSKSATRRAGENPVKMRVPFTPRVFLWL